MSGAKRRLEREKLRAEGRLKHRGKKRCKWCGQWGCACKPSLDTSILEKNMTAEAMMMEADMAIALPLTILALAKRRKQREEEQGLYVRPNEGSP